METDSIYAKIDMNYEKYFKILENNKDLFGKDLGQITPENLHKKIVESIFLSSKSYSYICENYILENENKMKTK